MGRLKQSDEIATKVEAITPSDTVTYADFGVLYVGVGGDVAVSSKTTDDTPVVLKNVPDGTILPLYVSKVWATDTTATDIVLMR